MPKPLILTMGDPTGIGPEIIVKATAVGGFNSIDRPLIVAGDPGFLLAAADVCGLPAQLSEQTTAESVTQILQIADHSLMVFPLSALPTRYFATGQPDATCGRAMAQYIRWACDACLQDRAAGMVTAPINKLALQAAGERFPGHTELLASRCGVGRVVMMLAGRTLRVSLATTHCALREVPKQLSVEGIFSTIKITVDALQKFFGKTDPCLAVLALNPHAGEGGLFGTEEKELIRPAINHAIADGMNVKGPFSADTLFWSASQGDYDAVICMYHDQGLIPLKLLHFEDGVNITLGLPIIRTSVDHGTAYDLCGTGKASPASLIAAVSMAAGMADKAIRAS
ncbi:MAG: 4-hydroxythreonine-4-phosphate dehydrogenase PdxA [Deltaproteobacteria bacterium]|nr:4-hydroxythreonine-4-phosphate dehydrogenase PdxA [Deltaproteobacteria bacterium]